MVVQPADSRDEQQAGRGKRHRHGLPGIPPREQAHGPEQGEDDADAAAARCRDDMAAAFAWMV